jgi:hypothetical protein
MWIPQKTLASQSHRLVRDCHEVNMKKYPCIFAAIVLVAISTVGCAQSSDKGAVVSSTVGPELRWKYDTGG